MNPENKNPKPVPFYRRRDQDAASLAAWLLVSLVSLSLAGVLLTTQFRA